MLELWLMAALLAKHFVFDFFWQPPWMWQNKGRIGAWGGIAHSGVHAFATMIILFVAFNNWDATAPPPRIAFIELTWWEFYALAAIPLGEFVIHYATDFAKMNINAKMGWGATTHNEFWQLTGFDQLIHQLTYVGIVWLVVTHGVAP